MSNDNSTKRMAAFAIENMFSKKRYFDITTIRDVCALMGRPPAGPAYAKLGLLHCVDWNDIPEDIMRMIPVWINELLGGPRLSAVMIPALREGNVHQIGFED